MVFGSGTDSARQARKQALQAGLGAVDLFVQPLGIVAGRGELLPQLDVLGAQPLAERHELRDFGLQGTELRLHAGRTMLQKSSRVN